MSDSENTSLMSQQAKKKAASPDWGKFGLSQEPVKASYTTPTDTQVEEGYQHTDINNKNELFQEDQNYLQSKVWWKANFFISEPILFGTWDGVFTSCMINLLGVVIFLRMGWIVGNAGISLTILTIILAVFVVLIVALSGIGVCERCRMESGGVYFLISHVLGARIGGSVGIIYCFAQSVSCSLSVMGFGESIAGLAGQEDNPWIAKAVAFGLAHSVSCSLSVMGFGESIAGLAGQEDNPWIAKAVAFSLVHSVSCSLSVMGFGESIAGLAGQEDNPWIAKAVAFGLVLLLLGINVAGVKWVIRLQLLLLAVLFFSVMDFLVGSFVHTDIKNGVVGYRQSNFHDNSGPSFLPGQSFFTIFGLFFSTVTGILAGINMSGDLKDPFHNIPTGTLSALGVSTCLYISFALVLGATCIRNFLHTEYMISEKVSIIGVLWLAGLYISSVSACMGSLYGPPRILQTIANENVIPVIRVLGHGRGPNKVPVYALIVIILIVLLFVLVGDVNTLAPIVTTSFMMSYIAVNYAYFALAMSYDKRQERDLRFGVKSQPKSPDLQNGQISYGTSKPTESFKDSFQNIRSDLDKLFPERLTHRGQHHVVQEQRAGSPTEPDFDATKRHKSLDNVSEHSDASQVLLGKEGDPRRPPNMEITKQPRSWYSFLCNRWLSLFGTVICITIMFGTQWAYSLVEVIVAIVVYIYIGQANPGYFPGIAEFNFYEWIKSCILRCVSGKSAKEEIVVAPSTPAVTTLAAQLTEDNEDFASRGRYHQSEVVQGENFDDYDSED